MANRLFNRVETQDQTYHRPCEIMGHGSRVAPIMLGMATSFSSSFSSCLARAIMTQSAQMMDRITGG